MEMRSPRSKPDLAKSVPFSDHNDKVLHSILQLALSCFFSSFPREPAYLQFNKAPAILICFLQLFLLFESWDIKAPFESCSFSCGNLYHVNCTTWNLHHSQAPFLLSGERSGKGAHMVQVASLKLALTPKDGPMVSWCAKLSGQLMYAVSLLLKNYSPALSSVAMAATSIPLYRIPCAICKTI